MQWLEPALGAGSLDAAALMMLMLACWTGAVRSWYRAAEGWSLLLLLLPVSAAVAIAVAVAVSVEAVLREVPDLS